MMKKYRNISDKYESFEDKYHDLIDLRYENNISEQDRIRLEIYNSFFELNSERSNLDFLYELMKIRYRNFRVISWVSISFVIGGLVAQLILQKPSYDLLDFMFLGGILLYLIIGFSYNLNQYRKFRNLLIVKLDELTQELKENGGKIW